MLRKRSVVLSAFAAISSFAIASGASADGTASLKDGPAPTEDYVWDGLYVGVGIGAGSFDHDVDANSSKTKTLQKSKCVKKNYYDECTWGPWEDKWTWPTKEKSASSSSDDDWNVFGTMQIGYDRLIHKRFLIGAFADLDFYDDAGDSFSDPWVETFFGKWEKEIGSIDGKIDVDHVWSIGGRFGFLVTPRILLYGVGGYSEASLDGAVTVSLHGLKDPLTINAPDELNGYFFGGGAEFKLRKNVSFKLEYRHTEFDGEGGSASTTIYSPTWEYGCDQYRIKKDIDAHADFDSSIDTIRGVLVLKFDEPERPVAALK